MWTFAQMRRVKSKTVSPSPYIYPISYILFRYLNRLGSNTISFYCEQNLVDEKDEVMSYRFNKSMWVTSNEVTTSQTGTHPPRQLSDVLIESHDTTLGNNILGAVDGS